MGISKNNYNRIVLRLWNFVQIDVCLSMLFIREQAYTVRTVLDVIMNLILRSFGGHRIPNAVA